MPTPESRRRQQRRSTPDAVQPSSAHETRLALETLTNRSYFQSLCDELLSAHYAYRVRPRGVNPRGTVRGQPDSWGHTPDGKLCALEYGTNAQWRAKLEEDQASISQLAAMGEFSPQVFVFCTNRHIDATVERELIKQAKDKYGWELRCYGQGELAVTLNTDCQDIRRRYLGIRIEHHSWSSLLDACEAHRQGVLLRYAGKYDSSLYVNRHAERTIDVWYQEATATIREGKLAQQLLVIVDQAGAGKSSLLLHLGEHYGSAAPVILLPASLTLTDDHALEREMVTTVGYAVEGNSYQSDLNSLLQLCEYTGLPFLVMIDAANESHSPERVRKAITQLLISHRGRPLLILLTCRDAMWPQVQDPVWRSFAFHSTGRSSEEIAESLGLLDDDEFDSARQLYFDHWKVSANLGPDMVRLLRSPLLLRVFVEVYQGRTLGYVSGVAAGQLWREYWNRKLHDVDEAMGRRVRVQAIESALDAIASRMLQRDAPVLTFDDLRDIAGIQPDDSSGASLLVRLKDASLLLEDPPGTIRFAHEPVLEFELGRIISRDLGRPTEFDRALQRLERLATDTRWRQVVLYAAENASTPTPVISRLLLLDDWLAAEALVRVGVGVDGTCRTAVIESLIRHLSGRYELERRRAASLLGRLNAEEAIAPLCKLWLLTRSETALRALVRMELADPEILKAFVFYLGRQQEWYFADDRALVEDLSSHYRARIIEQAISSLADEHQGSAAAHALGYLRSEAAIEPLLARLRSAGWADPAAFLALQQVGTPEAYDALEKAMGEAGGLAAQFAQEEETARKAGDSERLRDLEFRHDNPYWALETLRVNGFQHTPAHVIVPFLVRLLRHVNFYVRLEAIQSLKQLGAASAASAIVEAAVNCEKEFGTSMAIDSALHRFGRRIDAEPFLALVEDGQLPTEVRRRAVQALGLSGDRRALGPLLRLLDERAFLFNVIQSLGELREPSAILALSRLLSDKDPKILKLRHLVVTALGKIGHSDAFPVLAKYARGRRKDREHVAIEALVATGRDRAIPVLEGMWRKTSVDYKYSRQEILRSLMWLGTESAIVSILRLVIPQSTDDVAHLAGALGGGRGLMYLGRTRVGIVDDRVVAILKAGFKGLDAVSRRTTIWALESIGTPKAIEVLRWIALDSRNDIPVPDSRAEKERTVRDFAVITLQHMGIAEQFEELIDLLLGEDPTHAEFWLTRLERGPVVSALRAKLPLLSGGRRARVLRLLGWLGDKNVLRDVRRHLEDEDASVADAAYEAEQRVLGLPEVL